MWFGLRVAGIGLVAFAIFAPALRFDFVYDDTSQVLDNPWIWHARDLPNLVSKAVWAFKGEGVSNYYRPIQMLVYYFLGQVSGRSALAFHLASILTHTLVTVAAAILLRRITGERRALIAAFLFAVHPVHVESVAWIAGSTDLNCALLGFVFLIVCVVADDAVGIRRLTLLFLAGALFFLALWAKETAVVFPLLALLLPADAARSGGAWWKRALPLPLVTVAMLALYIPLRLGALGGLTPEIKHPEMSPGSVVASALSLVPSYLSLAFCPWRLVPDRVFDPPAGFFDHRVVIGVLLLGVAAVTAARTRRTSPPVAFGIGLLILPVLPVLQVQYVGTNAQTDRYLYIPSLGACLLVAEFVGYAWRRRPSPQVHRLVTTVCGMVAVLAIAQTLAEASIWRDNLTLSRVGIAREPRSVNMRLLMASTLLEQGDLGGAARVATQAAALAPREPRSAAFAVGLRIQHEARTPGEEVARLRAAIRELPGQPFLWKSLAAACLRARQFEAARTAAETALTFEPHDTATIINLASAFGGLGDYAGQEREARRAVDLDPGSALAWMSLGEVRLVQGDLREYEASMSRAVECDPSMARAHVGLSDAAFRRGDTLTALAEAERAVQLAPGEARLWTWLARVREQRGDHDGARAALERAAALAAGSQVPSGS